MSFSKSRIIALVIIEILIFSLSMLGISYAYYSINIKSEFNTTSIDALTNGVGTISFINRSTSLFLELSNNDMISQNNDVFYYATSTGKSTSGLKSEIARATVSPSTDTNYYECNYNITITHSGINDMYDYYKNTYVNSLHKGVKDEMVLFINDSEYDWYTNGLPQYYANTLLVTANNSSSIFAGFRIKNISGVNQKELAGKDISINLVGSGVTCHAVNPTITYKFFDTVKNNSDGLDFYIKTASSGSATLNEICSVFNNTTICLTPYADEDMNKYYELLTNNGLTCNDTYSESGILTCFLNNKRCSISKEKISCGIWTNSENGSECSITKSQDNNCNVWS